MINYLDLSIKEYGAGPNHVLLVFGWGNDLEHPGPQWLIGKLTGAGHTVTAVRIPTDIRDFKKEIISPVIEIANHLGDFTLVAHSMGSIAGRYVQNAQKRIFLSPFWGIPKRRRIPLMAPILKMFRWLGTPLFYRGYEKPELGDLTMDIDMSKIPKHLPLRTIFQFWSAQNGMPPVRGNDHIIFTEADKIIDLERIMTANCGKTGYQGGHQFFTSSGRDRIVKGLLHLIG